MNFKPDPKPSTHRNRKFLTALRELQCVDCGASDGTVVAAHSNQGKGLALKSPDENSMALCARCHSRLDQPGLSAMTRDERREYEREMNLRTLRMMVNRGILHF